MESADQGYNFNFSEIYSANLLDAIPARLRPSDFEFVVCS